MESTSNSYMDITNNLINMRDQIEKMSKFNQIEILKILVSNPKIVINENKYGIHINLSELNEETLNHLMEYIKYVNTQEAYLKSIEQEKENYKNTYFTQLQT